MQEKLQFKENSYFLPQFLSLQDQKLRLRCPSHNSASFICVSSECTKMGLMCLQQKCQCRKIHYKCHHILLDRVLQSVEKHRKQIPEKAKEIYKTIYDMINQMIEKLSQLRTKFQREEMYFGLRQEELDFMDLINDNKIQKINGKIVSTLEKTFDLEIQLNKNTKEDIIKDFQNKMKDFDKLCIYIQDNYLQTRGIVKNIVINQNLFKDSNIIKSSQQIQLLNKWLHQSFDNKKLQSKLLFRASQHNFESSQFHKACDGKKETLLIVKNEFNKIIGGFTPLEWSSKGQNLIDFTYRSFIFSLSLKQKYLYMNKNYRTIGCYNNDGPKFGGSSWDNSDIHINQKCNVWNSLGNLGNTYNIMINNEKKYQQKSKETNALFTGNANGNTFKVLQYEIYQIIPTIQ